MHEDQVLQSILKAVSEMLLKRQLDPSCDLSQWRQDLEEIDEQIWELAEDIRDNA